jgi:hypothetical protein
MAGRWLACAVLAGNVGDANASSASSTHPSCFSRTKDQGSWDGFCGETSGPRDEAKKGDGIRVIRHNLDIGAGGGQRRPPAQSPIGPGCGPASEGYCVGKWTLSPGGVVWTSGRGRDSTLQRPGSTPVSNVAHQDHWSAFAPHWETISIWR